MNFQLTDDQKMILESAARFAADQAADADHADPSGFHRTRWNAMAELGWIAAGIPAELGGIGGAVESALIARALGRQLLGRDFLAHAVLAPQLLVAAGDDGRRVELLSEVIAGTLVLAAAVSEPGMRGDLAAVTTRLAGGRLTGRKTLVLGAEAAHRLIVSARRDDGELELLLVDRRGAGVTLVPTPLVDGSGAATVILEDAPAEPVGASGAALPALKAMAANGIAAIAAEAVGMIEGVTDLTADYLRNRSQFGVPLGQFQVLQHKLADMAIDLEMTQAYLLVALAAVAQGGAASEPRLSGVKAAVGEALRRVTGAAVQAHGGMGMSQEYPAGRYLQRMVVLDKVLGSPSDHLRRLARAT